MKQNEELRFYGLKELTAYRIHGRTGEWMESVIRSLWSVSGRR